MPSLGKPPNASLQETSQNGRHHKILNSCQKTKCIGITKRRSKVEDINYSLRVVTKKAKSYNKDDINKIEKKVPFRSPFVEYCQSSHDYPAQPKADSVGV